jgi:putative NADH-flavin reductase
MRVVVFGATGKTGELAWRKAIEAGHDVTVFGRSVERRYADEHVAKAQGDVLDAEAVSQAIAGQDAVLVCLGPISTKDRTTLSQGAENIRAAMQSHAVRRVVFISTAGVGESWSHIPWYSKLLFATMLKTILAEHGREEEILGTDPLDWTAVRAAILTDKPGSGRVLASNTAPIKTISRADLAQFLVNQLAAADSLKQAISVTSG